MIQQLLSEASARLSSVTETPRLDAEILLAHAFDKPRSYLYAYGDEKPSQMIAERFADAIRRRINREPIAYITGMREFWSLELITNAATLIPRPETEVLVSTALTLLKESENPLRVADLGTGSGAIAIALAYERPSWKIFATDVSESALSVARENAQRFALTPISFYQGSWCAALPCADFDMIVSNPPYIAEAEWNAYAEGLRYEPRDALVAGRDGLDALYAISKSAKRYLKPGGYLLLEHGFSQAESVRQYMLNEGYTDVATALDLSLHERVTMGRQPG